MARARILGTVLIGLVVGGASHAADFSDPTWPCIQRKVGELSLGLMWPDPIEPADAPDAEAEALAEKLALRRIELETLQPEVAAFAAAHDGDPQALARVFERVFKSLNTRRSQIIAGIERFSLSQIALAERIEAARVEMEAALDAAEPDYDRIDALEEQIDWDQTIHADRQRSITYLCETPQLLERRLFAISQMLQGAVRDDG
jgi:hypothetical protein